MSELTLRDFPPVEPLELRDGRGRRYSMTLLRHANLCMRSAYLYLKYRGGPPTHYLNRGTVAHIAFEAMLRHMLEHGEPWYDEKGRLHTAGELPMDVCKDIMAEAIATTPLTVPAEEQDRLRVMASHFSEGVSIEPARIVGIEQKVVLPIEEFTVVGKLDLALRASEDVLEIWDWKTAYAMTKYEEIAEKLRDGRMGPKSFQLLVYVLLAAFGIPVESRACEECDGTGELVWFTASPDSQPVRVRPGDVHEVRDPDRTRLSADECEACGQKGYVDVPTQDEPLGSGARLFRAYEKYPQFLYDDGIGSRGPLDVLREELLDHMAMLEGLVFKFAGALGEAEIPQIEPWKFEAVRGTHCHQCPARSECPLPEHLRSWAGEINSMEEAQEAAAKLEIDKAHHAARQKELRIFAGVHGPIRVGADEIWEFAEQTSRNTDWAAFTGALEEAMEFGKPFELADVQKVSTSNRFVKRKLEPEEIARFEDPRPEPDGPSPADRWGDDAPF